MLTTAKIQRYFSKEAILRRFSQIVTLRRVKISKLIFSVYFTITVQFNLYIVRTYNYKSTSIIVHFTASNI